MGVKEDRPRSLSETSRARGDGLAVPGPEAPPPRVRAAVWWPQGGAEQELMAGLREGLGAWEGRSG